MRHLCDTEVVIGIRHVERENAMNANGNGDGNGNGRLIGEHPKHGSVARWLACDVAAMSVLGCTRGAATSGQPNGVIAKVAR